MAPVLKWIAPSMRLLGDSLCVVIGGLFFNMSGSPYSASRTAARGFQSRLSSFRHEQKYCCILDG
jgi:hypothetical protein